VTVTGNLKAGSEGGRTVRKKSKTSWPMRMRPNSEKLINRGDGALAPKQPTWHRSNIQDPRQEKEKKELQEK